MGSFQASELRYRRLFEAARDGILIIDVATRKIVDANPFILDLLGYAAEDILGKELWEIGLLKDRAASEAAYRHLEESGVIRYDTLPLQSKTGEIREVEFVSNLYHEGDALVIQCNIRDITERRSIESQRAILVQMAHLLSLGEMASGVAHDINQSLAIVAGYSDVALTALTQPDIDLHILRETLEMISRAAMDGGEANRRLLAFARGQAEGPPEVIVLDTLLTEVSQLTAPRWRDHAQAEGRPIMLHVDVERDAIVRGWPASLREALTNLVFNAVDALPQGGTILLRARQQGEHVVVDVADSGIGISADLQARIFEPFFTTKGERGTGLGLAQVLRVVELHGGHLTLDSAPGQGTIFHVSLPAFEAVDADESVRHALPSTSPLRILAVDDEPALARLIAQMLRPDGHTVVEAHSGAEALDRLAAEPFDLVISDLGVPDMTGWDLAAEVLHTYPDTPVMLATGWGSQIAPEDALAHGVHSVITKPYRIVDLYRAIASLTAPKRPS